MLALLPLCALLAQTGAPAAAETHDAGVERPCRFTLPEGPSARAWEAARGSTEPAGEALELPPPLSDAAWDERDLWLAWSGHLRRAAAAVPSPPPNPAAARSRAWLAAFALSSSRSEEAWDHLAAALALEPALARALLPAFAAGALDPALSKAAAQRGDFELPQGALFAPPLPPGPASAAELERGSGRLARRAMQIDGLKIGGAVLGARVAIEYDGVQIDLSHQGGSACRLRVRLPSVSEFRARTTYVDWEPTAQLEPEIELSAAQPARTLYAQLEWAAPRRSRTLPAALPAHWRAHGVQLIASGSLARARGFAAALSDQLALACEALPPGDPRARESFGGARFLLPEGPEGAETCSHWLTQVERWAFERAP